MFLPAKQRMHNLSQVLGLGFAQLEHTSVGAFSKKNKALCRGPPGGKKKCSILFA